MSPSSDPIDPSDLAAQVDRLRGEIDVLRDVVRTLVAVLGTVNAAAFDPDRPSASADERYEQFRMNDFFLSDIETKLDAFFSDP